MYRVELSKQAEKSFDLLVKSQPRMAKAVVNALDHLANDPNLGIPLRGELKGLFKYRVGSYRIIYQITKTTLLVTAIDIGHRRDVYRQ